MSIEYFSFYFHLLVFRERPLYSFAYDPYKKKLLKSASQKYIYSKDLLSARVTILWIS